MGSLLRLLRSLFIKRGAAEQKPYTALAVFYDRMMSHVDYSAWAEYIDRICKTYGHNINTVVEGACGTGSLASELEKSGYQIAGFDLSVSMLKMARLKSHSDFFQADLRALPLKKGVDAVFCLYDSILYLTEQEIIDLFYNMADVVKPGGLFVFDVVTESYVLDSWYRYSDYDQTEQWKCWRSGWYDREKNCQYTEIVLKSRLKKEKLVEHHQQWVYPLDFFNRHAGKSGWSVAGCFHEFTFDPGSEESGRVHFILSREK